MIRSLLITLPLLFTMTLASAGESPLAGVSGVRNIATCTSGADASYEGFIDGTLHAFEQVSRRTPPRDMIERAFPVDRYEAFKVDYGCFRFEYQVGDTWVEGFYVDRRDGTASPRPVIVYNRGGNGSFGALTLSQVMTRMAALADAGYVVLASQYREADEFGGDDVNDVLTLATLARTLPTADADALGMFGWSRGGMMSFMAARGNPAIKAIVAGGTPSDLARELESRPGMERVYQARIPDFASDREAQLARRSVTTFVDEIPATTPVLLIHGDADERVSVDSALRLAELLAAAGHPHETLIVPGGDHGLRRHDHEVMAKTIAWFDAHLKKRAVSAG